MKNRRWDPLPALNPINQLLPGGSKYHLTSLARHDLDGVLADYSSDAVLFTPAGPLKGPEAISRLFQALIAEFREPGSSFTLQDRFIEGEYGHITWTAETAANVYEFATDTFVVRNGKIVAQSFAAKMKAKSGVTPVDPPPA